MKKKIIITTFIAVVALLATVNTYNNENKIHLSELALENIDALANSESSDADFGGCYVTICNKVCTTGNIIHYFASNQKCTCSLCN